MRTLREWASNILAVPFLLFFGLMYFFAWITDKVEGKD